MRGTRTECLREENLPHGNSLKGPPKTSKGFSFVTQSSLPVYLSVVFEGALDDPLGGGCPLGDYLFCCPSSCCPLIFLQKVGSAFGVFQFSDLNLP